MVLPAAKPYRHPEHRLLLPAWMPCFGVPWLKLSEGNAKGNCDVFGFLSFRKVMKRQENDPQPPHKEVCASLGCRLYHLQSSQNHRMAWVEKDLNAHQIQPPAMCRVANDQPRLPRATSSLALNASRGGASTASLGNLFQCCLSASTHSNLVLGCSAESFCDRPTDSLVIRLVIQIQNVPYGSILK